ALGLLLAAVGAAPATGQPRFTAGLFELFDGVSFIAALIGLFAVSELLTTLRDRDVARPKMPPRLSFREEFVGVVKGVTQTFRYWAIAVQSTFVGLIFGVIPGGGTAVSNFLSYSIAK